ncbi:unnamed protein product [Soboliphyme baturini]|uniref:BTB domain-containing protein n=1 Tax=Soboliphyme baturini TaxID=241478 RepID=A0A183IJU9_9BILA|nr:unnamed protein product [Soboliphyme baturini]
MRCSQLEQVENPYSSMPSIALNHERPYLMLPPLIDWCRIIEANCDHRMGAMIESTDVVQAARILLPYLDCPPPILGDEQIVLYDETSESVEILKEHVSFLVIASTQPEKMPSVMEQLRIRSLDVHNSRGLTPLMLACLHGDLERVKALLNLGTSIDAIVAASATGSRCQAPQCDVIAGWTALNFAVIGNNLEEVKFLLDKGASLELPAMVTETPLQVAAMTGNYEAAKLLLSCGADPFYSTLKAPPVGSAFRRRGSPPPVVLAASHGQRKLFHLLTTCRRYCSDEETISLQDFLAEASETGNKKAPREGKSGPPAYRFIKESAMKAVSPPPPPQLPQFSKRQRKVLTEAMYVAAENEYLDIVLDVSSLGIPWNSYIWTATLSAAVEIGRKALIQMLFDDYLKNPFEITDAFVETGLPLMFDILLRYQDDILRVHAMQIFAVLYGANPIQPMIVEEAAIAAPRIDAKYVNNPEMSDIQFLLEDRTFYAHKIVLANASDRFKRLLDTSNVNGQCLIAIKDISYDVFKIVMRFLYTGEFSDGEMNLSILADVLQVSSGYGLKQLKKRCEQVLSQSVTLETCLFIYDVAQKNSAADLMRFCEGFLLQNGPRFMQYSENFHIMLLSGSHDLANKLLAALRQRLKNVTVKT